MANLVARVFELGWCFGAEGFCSSPRRAGELLAAAGLPDRGPDGCDLVSVFLNGEDDGAALDEFRLDQASLALARDEAACAARVAAVLASH